MKDMNELRSRTSALLASSRADTDELPWPLPPDSYHVLLGALLLTCEALTRRVEELEKRAA